MGEKWEVESDGVWCGDIVGRGGCFRPCRTLLGKPVKDTVKDGPVRSEETEAVWFLGSEVDREPQKKEHLKH